jgi:hypothetical protein
MDFLDPKKKRAHRIQLFIGYALMAIAIGFSTWIVVNITFGFGVDRHTGNIIQNGLVFVDAHPESAAITLNGQNKGNTNARLTIPAGAYTLELTRPGYRPWKRGFTLAGGRVERYVYPFLFPTNLVTKDVDLFTAAPGFATASPDRRWYVSQQGNSLTNFEHVDLVSATNTTTALVVPADLFTAAPGDHRMQLVEWSTDNRHFLVKHTYGDNLNEFVMMDREEPASSVNITKLFPALPLSQVALRDKRFDQFYVLTTDAALQSLDTKSKIVTPVASRVLAFKAYGSERLLYVTTEDATPGLVSVRLRDNNTIYNLRTLPANTNYLLDLASYNGSQYVVIGAASEGKVYNYKNPINDLKQTPRKIPTPIAILKVAQPAAVSFSTTAQMVVVQGGSNFAVYDAETDRYYRYDIKKPVDGNQNATWMDGHRITILSQGRVVIFDYDGTNSQTLSPANVGYIPFFDRDYTAMYTIAPSVQVKDHVALTRTELKIK